MKKILLLMAIFSLVYPLRWEFEVVPQKIGVIEMDTSDIPHTVCGDRGILSHGMRENTGWWFEGVDTLPPLGMGHSSFKLASGIYPCIAYSVEVRERIQWGPKYLKYAEWDGREWNIQVVDSVDRVQAGPHLPVLLSVDSKNYPHIIYMDRYRIYNPDSSSTTYLRDRYAKWNGDGWEFTTLDSTNSKWDNGFIIPSAMVLDNEGYPHMVGQYWHCTEWGVGNCTTAIVHLYEDNTGWHTDTVCDTVVYDATYNPYSYKVITIDPEGRPIIIFVRQYYKGNRIASLHLAKKEGEHWNFQDMEVGAFSAIGCIPRWDKKGRLHIAYLDRIVMKYGIWDGKTWTIDTVYIKPDSIHSPVYPPKLALDSKGYPHLVFKQEEVGSYYVRGLPEEGIKEQKEKLNHPELIISPNPVKGVANIRYETPVREAINLSIYNATGRLVKTLVRAQNLKPGVYTIKWDERDAKGKILPSGIYFIKLEAKGINRIKKVILMR